MIWFGLVWCKLKFLRNGIHTKKKHCTATPNRKCIIQRLSFVSCSCSHFVLLALRRFKPCVFGFLAIIGLIWSFLVFCLRSLDLTKQCLSAFFKLTTNYKRSSPHYLSVGKPQQQKRKQQTKASTTSFYQQQQTSMSLLTRIPSYITAFIEKRKKQRDEKKAKKLQTEEKHCSGSSTCMSSVSTCNTLSSCDSFILAPVDEESSRLKRNKQFERIIGPRSKIGEDYVEQLQSYSFGIQNDSFSEYNDNDLMHDIRFYIELTKPKLMNK